MKRIKGKQQCRTGSSRGSRHRSCRHARGCSTSTSPRRTVLSACRALQMPCCCRHTTLLVCGVGTTVLRSAISDCVVVTGRKTRSNPALSTGPPHRWSRRSLSWRSAAACAGLTTRSLTFTSLLGTTRSFSDARRLRIGECSCSTRACNRTTFPQFTEGSKHSQRVLQAAHVQVTALIGVKCTMSHQTLRRWFRQQ